MAAILDPARIPGARARPLPRRIPVQLATLAREPPAGEDWLHELKYDGYRMLARIEAGGTRFVTRNDLDWTGRFADLAAVLSSLRLTDSVLDGEIVRLDAHGVSSFSALQDALSHGRAGELVYVAFDLLFLRGYDLRAAPLEERRRALAAALARAPARIRLSEHRIGGAAAFFAQACERRLEGIISKRRAAPYRGGRSGDWLKTKCVNTEEFVIVGFTEPQRSRVGLGALLVGYYTRSGELAYAGKVGTGFTAEVLQRLRRKLERIERREATVRLPQGLYMPARVHWVQPRLVAQLAFAEWTSDNMLRQARFLGLREDKSPREIVLDRTPPTVVGARKRSRRNT